jgi:hypothetical protein
VQAPQVQDRYVTDASCHTPLFVGVSEIETFPYSTIESSNYVKFLSPVFAKSVYRMKRILASVYA